MSQKIDGIGQVCLRKEVELVNSVCGRGWDWSGVFQKVGGIGQDCLRY